MTRILFFSILLIGISCGQKTKGIQASKESITESVYASGVIKTINQYQVFSNVNGILQKSFVKEGDSINKGGILFTIYNETNKLSKENAQLLAEYSNYSNNQAKLKELKINIELALQKMRQDSILYQRQKNLWEQNIGSKIEFEQKELAYKNSLTLYKSAQLRLNDLENQLKFNSKQSKKGLEISEQILSDYTIRSAINGKIYSVLKNEGELVTVQSPIAIIGDANDFLVELQIDEYDISKIKKGQKVYLRLDSYKDSVFEARIDRIYPIMNERSKTFTVEALFITKPKLLYPNLSSEANIVLQEKDNAITIPRDYLMGDTAVMLLDKSIRLVKTGLKDYQKVEILSGITESDKLILPEE
ncbi:MAG: efflux RND transporter periplasmic adaptor subunit [Bacteroidia bacterium]